MATMPIRGPATAIESDDHRAHETTEQHPLGPESPAWTPSRLRRATRSTTSVTDCADEDGAGDRLEAADAIPETALCRDLQRAAETGDERERRCNSRRAHGVTLYPPFL